MMLSPESKGVFKVGEWKANQSERKSPFVYTMKIDTPVVSFRTSWEGVSEMTKEEQDGCRLRMIFALLKFCFIGWNSEPFSHNHFGRYRETTPVTKDGKTSLEILAEYESSMKVIKEIKEGEQYVDYEFGDTSATVIKVGKRLVRCQFIKEGVGSMVSSDLMNISKEELQNPLRWTLQESIPEVERSVATATS